MEDFYNVYFHSAYSQLSQVTDLSKQKKILDLGYIYPRGVHGGAAFFCLLKKCFYGTPYRRVHNGLFDVGMYCKTVYSPAIGLEMQIRLFQLQQPNSQGRE